MLRRLLYITILTATLSILGCDKGLAPPPPESIATISGTVRFAGTYPPCDSVKLLAVVLSENRAPFSVSAIIANYNTTIFAYQLDTCGFQDTTYSFVLKPGTYRYLGVVQLYGDSLLSDWQVVGFSHTPEDSAVQYVLAPGQNRTNVDLRVRFDSLPRQPFIR